MNKSIIYGSDNTERIVCVEPSQDDQCTLYIQREDGSIKKETRPMTHYILYHKKHSDKMVQLKGDQHYKYAIGYKTAKEKRDIISKSYKSGLDCWTYRDPKEGYMLKSGVTYYKGMTHNQVSLLSFDIETTGLVRDNTSNILIISNTYRSHDGKTIKRLFSYDEFSSQAAMIDEWCAWVCAMDPSILLGHNVFNFDLPYIQHVAKNCGTEVILGRDGSSLFISDKNSLFRKDGSQAYDYNNCYVHGREIVDTFFLSIKFDVRRKFDSYGLKYIEKHLGIEPKGREVWDFEANPQSRVIREGGDLFKRFKKYAADDADSPIAMYDKMIPGYFHYTQSIPRSLQSIINTATGSQINSLMVRAYLQQGHSIAKASDKVEFEGAISLGIPGLHKNVLRLDVKSMYPSIMLEYKIFDSIKDPQNILGAVVEYFTKERLANKALFESTGDQSYDHKQSGQKITINSMYGFLGAPGLNYNYPKGAAEVTSRGREILKKAVLWATGKEFTFDSDAYEFGGLDDQS